MVIFQSIVQFVWWDNLIANFCHLVDRYSTPDPVQLFTGGKLHLEDPEHAQRFGQ